MYRQLFRAIQNSFSNYLPSPISISYNHFKDDYVRKSYNENGYVIIRNIVTEQSIEIIKETYQKLNHHKDFYTADGFITSANYGFDIQHQLHRDLMKVNEDILPKIFDMDKIYHDLLNVLVIKFTKDKKEFYAHQDIALIDELQGPTTFAWIPASDISEQNGALLVLPKSHKWFRWQRTHDQSESPLKNLRDEILKHMIPLYLNKGDLVLFDNSLVHASLPNFTNEIRVAMNTGIAPKDFDLIHYQRIKDNIKQIEKYQINEAFWLNGHYENPNTVPLQYHPPVIEDLRYPYYLSKKNFKTIIDKYT